jgi:hypothetical protein
MNTGRPLYLRAGILLLCAVGLAIGIEARGAGESAMVPEPARSDLVRIDVPASIGKPELPAVMFPHDKHTEALLKEKKDCKTCHQTEDGKMSLTFKGSKGSRPEDIREVYHSNCVACHMEMLSAGKKTGPSDGSCRSCHNADTGEKGNQLEIGMNKTLHFRHISAKNIAAYAGEKENCGQCHHEYDKQAKKTFYAKGKESTCRYCHLEAQKEDVRSMKEASHEQCVLCHLDLSNKGVKEVGPYQCSGCHGAEGQAQTAKKNREFATGLPNGEVPRVKREQPDSVLITFDPKLEAVKASKPILMNPVAFDHKAHENYTESCQECHHAAMDSCEKCHTLSGSKEGGFIRLEEAMHLTASKQSCQGCHAEKQAAVSCAGCHNHMDKARRSEDAGCRECHAKPPENLLPATGSANEAPVLTPEEKTSIAEAILKDRNRTPGMYSVEDIPEKVEIRDLSNQYEPAEMPHRKIVLTLVKGISDSSAAAYFHSEQGVICQGCHHNGPAAKQPPRCGNCHGKPFDRREPNRPGLQAAFHEECMGCHKAMAIAKPAATACTECHKEKQK